MTEQRRDEVGWLRRQWVGAVQSYQWHVLNRSESWLTQAIRTEYAGSYMVERPFQEAIGSMKMIAGTAYMIRADLLRELGWGRSLTEDWELTLRLYTRGYKVVYTPYAETPAECVSTFTRLARQRMRWAEGHSYNVRKWFWSVLRSPRIRLREKVGFAFYSTYYLQALFMFVGSFCWLLSEVVFKVHVPEWTSLMGWSLVISNLLSLPLMNLSGLVMEGAPRRDLSGILGAVAISFLLVPFQAWAAVKGLFERNEGPWFRTPKTGRITDPVWPLRRLGKLRRWLLGPKSGEGQPPGPARISANISPPRRPARRLAWVMIGGLMLCLGALGVGALHAPVVEAVGTMTLYLHGASTFTMDEVSPIGSQQTFFLGNGATRTWHTPSSTAAAQTIAATTTFSFTFWASGPNTDDSQTRLTFAYSSSSTCSSPTTIAQATFLLHTGANQTTATFTPASSVAVPTGSFFCWTMLVLDAGADAGRTLLYDDSTDKTHINSSQTIFIPEFALLLVGVALLAPLATRRGVRLRTFLRRHSS
ncbi:MAG TPA: glycosyltransferase family 2 protein [Candidatus Dormibacteraeota bacterium]|nr:glycosyltransferase family 2 protein [Candidatus Dormibacteraeota bacterium]